VKNFIFLLLVSYGGYHWYESRANPEGSYGHRHNELIMYSLTTCSKCKYMKRELERKDIEFTEHYIDEDISKRDELTEKLIAAGFKKGAYGVPSFDVHGIMLPNNPKLKLIEEKLALD